MKKLNQIWHSLTTPLSQNEDDARREHMTRVIFLMVGGGILIMSVIVPIFDFSVGEPEYTSSLLMLGTDILMLAGWLLIRRGYWRFSRFIFPAIFLALASFLIFSAGLITTGVLQLAIAVVLTAMLFGSKAQWGTVLLSVFLYLILGWFSGERDIEVFFTGGIVVGFSLSGIAALQWFSSALLTASMEKLCLAEVETRKSGEKIRQQAARAEALAALSNLLTRANQDFQLVLDTTVRQCANLIGDGASIFLYSLENEFLELAAVYNPNPDAVDIFNQAMQKYPIRVDEGGYRQVIQTKQPLLVPFIPIEEVIQKASPERREFYKKLPLHSMMLAPLLIQGELFGVVGLGRHVPGHAYTPEDLTFLQDMADRSALAMLNARLYRELQQELAEREILIAELQNKNIQAETLRKSTMIVASTVDQTETVKRVLEQIKRVVRYDSASVWLYKGELAKMVGWVDLPHGAIAPGYYTINEKEPDYPLHVNESLHYILLDNVQENYPQFRVPTLNYIHSWMAIPLRVRGKLIGMITLDGHKPGLFTEEDAQQALTFANQVSITIENARLVSDLQTELSERKQAELALRFSEEKFSKAFHTTQVMMTIEEENHLFIDVNQAFLDAFGLERHAVVGHSAADLSILYDPDDLAGLRRAYQEKGRLKDYEIRLRHKSGDVGYALLSSDTFSLGSTQYTLTSGLDVSERKQAEAERERLITELQSKNDELERFTYTVSHDLKSPLVTISGFLGYLVEDATTRNIERLKKDIQRIQDAVQKMQRLLNELLELSRIGRMVNESEPIPFGELVDEALKIVHGRLKERGITVQVITPQQTHPNLLTVFGDRQRLVEVLQNLLENAAKYTGDQSNPKIEIGQQGEENGKSIFFVKDNGIGIAPIYHEKVFGLFEKLDPNSEGTGVGLALVKRIIEVHGGRIWIESEVGKGATFWFTLPVEPKGKG